MNLKTLYNSGKRAIDRCDNNPNYLWFDILWKLIQQAKLKLARKDQLENNIPDIWDYSSVLYIWARSDRMDFGKQFLKNKYAIDVLEVFEPNIDHLRQIPWINSVIHKDVKDIDESLEKKYDIIFRRHGPEHIEKEHLQNTLQKIEKYANKLVILWCPWWKFAQDELYENPFEKHVSAIYPTDFEWSDFNVSTIGSPDFPGSNILAWKTIEHTDI